MDQGTAIDAWIPAAPSDPAMLGLERKLDVLRAQLAACREGRDPGEEGITTWSRLEAQSQRIAALETLVADLRRQPAAASDLQTAIAAHRPAGAMPMADAGSTPPDAARARQEVIDSHRTLRSLGQTLIDMTARQAYAAARIAEMEARLADSTRQAELARHDRARDEARIAQLQGMCDAFAASTSWRLSHPIRVVGGWWKRRA